MKVKFAKKVLSFITTAAMVCSFAVSGMLSVSAAGNVLIDGTNFPDNVFREYVKKFDTNKDNILSSTEISNVKTIDVANYDHIDDSNIYNFKGIEYFTSMIYFHCGYHPVTSIDISKNTALERLECEECKLDALDVSNNKNLIELHCDRNNISSLDVSNNPDLQDLDCSKNNITSIDLSNNSEIYRFICSDNNITSLDLSNNPQLINDYVEIDGWPVMNDPTLGDVDRGFIAVRNQYKIKVVDGCFDLSTLPGRFDAEMADNWVGAECDADTNTLKNITGINGEKMITYTYDVKNSNLTAPVFTLIYDESYSPDNDDDEFDVPELVEIN